MTARSPSGGDPADHSVYTVESGSDELTTETVVRAIAAVTGDDPTTMIPLYERIDTDALNALFEPRPKESTDSVSVSFEVDEFAILVEDDHVVIADSNPDTDVA